MIVKITTRGLTMAIQYFVAENIVYQSLEHSRGIGEANWHDQILVVATGHVKGGPPLIPLPYPHHVVGVL
jgi:hypothetical protein